MVCAGPQVRSVYSPILNKSAFARREKRNAATQLTLGRREGEFLPDPRKDVALGNTTGVAFVDGRSKRGELRLVLLFLAL